MPMDTKQRNFYIFCGVIVVAWYAVREINEASQRAEYLRQQAIRAQRQKAKAKPKPAPATKAPAPPLPSVAGRGKTPAPKKAPPSPYAKLSGVWRGRTALDGRGVCNLSFELKEKEQPGHFSGFSSMTCASAGPLMHKKGIDRRAFALNRMDPEAAVLSGSMENGSIQLRTDKTVGSDSNGCTPTSFTLTPFGSNQLAAEWQEKAPCSGGHLILGRGRR